MKTVRMLVVCAAVSAAPLAMAQRWEFGGGVGTGFYSAQDIASAASGVASASIKPNIAGSVWVVNNSKGRWSGELRYDFQRGALRLKQDSTEASMSAMSHAAHYDFHYNFADTESRVRPYVAVGAGIKVFRGTGDEVLFQPLSRIALLTRAQDLVPMISGGFGFKVQVASRVQLRLDVHDYVTPFPKQVITPNVGSSVGGWMHDIVPMVGLSFTN